MSPKKDTQKSAHQGLSAEERAAMKETLKERKIAANKEEMEKAALEAIAKMKEPDRSMAKRIHEIVKVAAPQLTPKTWYGMPAYANQEGKVICFFQAASKFNVRYATFGFQPEAKLDDGNMWAASFALIQLTPAEESKIVALVKKAVS
ncbi:MAG: DUF1801 domain-containing protein [Chloroflexi bacterium]|nr:DUF1801 domain-containing protein [Chloroflexota bacterium]